MILAHRERLMPRPTQRELSVKRIREGAGQGPAARRPASSPGTTPSTPPLCCPTAHRAELSVSRVLRARGQMLDADQRLEEISTVVTAEH